MPWPWKTRVSPIHRLQLRNVSEMFSEFSISFKSSIDRTLARFWSAFRHMRIQFSKTSTAFRHLENQFPKTFLTSRSTRTILWTRWYEISSTSATCLSPVRWSYKITSWTTEVEIEIDLPDQSSCSMENLPILKLAIQFELFLKHIVVNLFTS